MTTTAERDALISVLCQSWHWDSNDEHMIIFEAGGTGQLISRAEMNVWIASQFIWKALDSTSAPVSRNQLCIEMQLTETRVPPWDSPSFTGRINEQVLTREAFVPKLYVITLERGTFLTSLDTQYKHKGGPEYSFQMTFDRSPYPPREEWREPEGGPETLKIWEKKTFCAGKIEGGEKKSWFKNLFQ
uniref:Uncharacterized protein n=1 Tax=Moniliophthora roreri TaxID=221103 RepID=A0A0W0G9G6_MONRR